MTRSAQSAADRQEALPRVCLLHNYRERRQMSMKLYADRLGEGLERLGVPLERVRPAGVAPTRLMRFSSVNKLDSYAGRFVSYPRLARRLEADVFHIVDHGQAYLVSSLEARRTVVTCHDIILLVLAAGRLGANFKPPFATHLLRHALRAMDKAGRIVADSEQTRRDLELLAGIDPARVEVVYPGLNYDYRHIPGARDEVRQKFGLGSGPLILQVGQVGFYKNLEGCLRVIAALRKGGIPAKLLRAGHKLLPEQLALARRLGVQDALHDLGGMGDEELARLYNAADVLLFPSLYEGFGWPPLEAMACGTVVVCSRAGSLPEVVGEAALTAEPEDILGLATHVANVLNEPLLAEGLRQRGFAQASKFNWDATATRMLALYRELIEG